MLALIAGLAPVLVGSINSRTNQNFRGFNDVAFVGSTLIATTERATVAFDISNPANPVRIAEGVRIGTNAVVGPYVQLERDVVVDPGVRLQRAVVWSGRVRRLCPLGDRCREAVAVRANRLRGHPHGHRQLHADPSLTAAAAMRQRLPCGDTINPVKPGPSRQRSWSWCCRCRHRTRR